MNDQESKEKAIAPALLKAAQGVAAAAEEASKELPAGATKAQQEAADAKSFAAVKKAVEGFDGRRRWHAEGRGRIEMGESGIAPTTYETSPLDQHQAQAEHQGRRLVSQAKKTAGYSAAIAAIAQGSLYNTQEAKAKTPEQVAQWYAFSVQLRDAAAAVNAGIHAGSAKRTAAGMTRLAQSCDDCHAVFHKAAGKDTDK